MYGKREEELHPGKREGMRVRGRFFFQRWGGDVFYLLALGRGLVESRRSSGGEDRGKMDEG